MNAFRKVLKWTLAIFLVVLVIVMIEGWLMFGDFVRSANTIDKLEDNLYSLEYAGDYGFDEFLEQGGTDSDEALARYLVSFLSKGLYKVESDVSTGDFGCSAVLVQDNNGTYYFGRNYDWTMCKTMVVHTKPDEGYESLSTCCLDFLGFGEEYEPDKSTMDEFKSLASIYVPLDGMNEKGLIVADLMAGDDEATHQRSEKPDLTTTTAIRLLLDKAADVEEAIGLLKNYDMNSSIGAAHHLSVADAKGRSVVIEYVDGIMFVEDTDVVTNHYLCDTYKKDIGSFQSHERYDILNAFEGYGDEITVRNLLESVAQKNYVQNEDSYEKTVWSIVYCPEGRCADFYFNENYDYSYGLILNDKGGFIKRQNG
ncbi:MAG: carcinine hydrolase/isopenicillin-N N-acyltransferase family protein [Erysipelotrichaceae bacterium]